MKLNDLVSFRRDLLFNGAVQIGWLENNPEQADKAAGHFVFHGSDYHGVKESDLNTVHPLIDTARFSSHIIEALSGDGKQAEPFALAIAGWGTGKSHLGLTLAKLLSNPQDDISQTILANLKMADHQIGEQLERRFEEIERPFLVVAINGMQDFDLVSEITRQIFQSLHQKGLNTAPLEDLRPRFKAAQNFIKSFYGSLKEDFVEKFGANITEEAISELLKCQDEEAFQKVSTIYEQKMGSPIHSVGQESIQQFLRVAKSTYCGPGRSFAGIFIIFDEFGRYLEFAVEKPHIAGSGGLQQLFEAVQENPEAIFLLCFIQYELKAYMSRVPSELKDSLNRYVSRYDSVDKFHLSTNLETLIANLLEKKNPKVLDKYLSDHYSLEESDVLMSKFKRWFPELRYHALWNDRERFGQIIQRGCWPLHPAATWLLYRLASVGKSLQHRSALTFLGDTYNTYQEKELDDSPWSIAPVALCTNDMITEFLVSEKYGQQGAVAHAYENVYDRYQHQITSEEIAQLKSILLAAKIGIRVESREECTEAFSIFSGLPIESVDIALTKLSKEYGVITWNDQSCQYEMIGDAVPRRAFIEYLESLVDEVHSEERAEWFARYMKEWSNQEILDTDFGIKHHIDTKEWRYAVTFSNVASIEGNIKYALRTWNEALGVDDPRGQLIYCYVGPESDVDKVRKQTDEFINKAIKEIGIEKYLGAPIAVVLIYDSNGDLGKSIAEYCILNERLNDDQAAKFSNFILDRKNTVHEELLNKFKAVEKQRDIVLACKKDVNGNRISTVLMDLFETVYENHIPFPFDGFHTARGNAAKDCQAFTRELFTGNLNQNRIAAMGSQQKNRAANILGDGWQAIDRDGSIRIRPGHHGVGKIIEQIDANLEKEGKINLGSVVRGLCKPPYGFNIASAGLLIGVFIAPRKDRIVFRQQNDMVGAEKWLQDAFQGNFLNIAILDGTEIQSIDEGTRGEWDKLLNAWDFETTYVGQIAYYQQSLSLKERIPIPPPLYYRLEGLVNRTKEAQSESKKWRDSIDDQQEYMETAYGKENVGNLTRCGAKLVELKEKMIAKSGAWAKDQYDEIEPLIQDCRQASIQFFDNWLKKQVVIDPKVISKFEHDMLRLVGGNLQKMELNDEYRKLEEHVDRVKSEVERRAHVKVIVDEVKVFVNNNRISTASRVKELKNHLENIRELSSALKDARNIDPDLPQISVAENLLHNFKKNCDEQLKTHNERAGSVWDTTINTVKDIQEILQEVRNLIAIYDEDEKNLPDFQLMVKFLNIFEDHYKKLTLLDLTKEDIEERCRVFVEQVEEALSEDDEIPWDISETYRCLIDSIQEQRRGNTKLWLDKHLTSIEQIRKMDVREANQLRIILLSPPVFTNEAESKRLSSTLDACQQRLNDLDVDGLLERFRTLSKVAQKDFLEKVKRIL